MRWAREKASNPRIHRTSPSVRQYQKMRERRLSSIDSDYDDQFWRRSIYSTPLKTPSHTPTRTPTHTERGGLNLGSAMEIIAHGEQQLVHDRGRGWQANIPLLTLSATQNPPLPAKPHKTEKEEKGERGEGGRTSLNPSGGPWSIPVAGRVSVSRINAIRY